MTKDEMWQKLIDDGIATEEEIQLVTDINGYTEETMLDILYARTGYRNFEQTDEGDGGRVMMMYCRNCGYVDKEECNTDKIWDNEGNHILVYVCPECGEIVREEGEDEE